MTIFGETIFIFGGETINTCACHNQSMCSSSSTLTITCIIYVFVCALCSVGSLQLTNALWGYRKSPYIRPNKTEVFPSEGTYQWFVPWLSLWPALDCDILLLMDLWKLMARHLRKSDINHYWSQFWQWPIQSHCYRWRTALHKYRCCLSWSGGASLRSVWKIIESLVMTGSRIQIFVSDSYGCVRLVYRSRAQFHLVLVVTSPWLLR